MEEHDRLGSDQFLHVHGFGPSRTYLLCHEGREYPSKAIVGVAHGYTRPDLGPLQSNEFRGGVDGAVAVLAGLSFDVVADLQRYPAGSAPSSQKLAGILGDEGNARSVADFPWEGVDLRHPGLYAWFVDVEGARALTAALGQSLTPGLLYCGQAGASSSKTGKASAATLLTRISGNHLSGNVDSSTWRRTLASLLLGERSRTPEGRAELDAWMRRHLRLVVAPLPDRAAVGGLEDAVLALLDPPLNLMGRPRTELRRALIERRSALRL
jgi:hypothetical protein